MVLPISFIENVEETVVNDDLPLAKEWAWDFDKGEFATRNKKPYLVEGVEAVKIWAYKALLTERFKHLFYSWNYGSELLSLIGSGLSYSAVESETKRFVEEALQPNPYILGVDNFNIIFEGDLLSIEFTLNTVYGDSEVSLSAN